MISAQGVTVLSHFGALKVMRWLALDHRVSTSWELLSLLHESIVPGEILGRPLQIIRIFLSDVQTSTSPVVCMST